MLDIKSMLPSELEDYLISIDEKKFRALQIFSWLHKGVRSFDEMTDLSLDLREKLSRHFYITVPIILEKQVSAKDGTIKYLWGLCSGGGNGDGSGNDGNSGNGGEISNSGGSSKTDSGGVESVLMEYNHGTTICISTQLGCKMGCAFCASAIGGFMRNLTASEMLDQVLHSMLDSGRTISNIVLMGTGEPLDNFDNVMRFAELTRHHKGLNIGARHLTLSTCGVIENIDRLADCGVQLGLAISLHAPDDETRTKLIPYNRKANVEAIFNAAKRYTDKTGRRVTYEYAMIYGINDSPQQAEMLCRLLRGTGSHLNLIMLSNIPECEFIPSSKENLEAFNKILTKNGVKFTTRRSLGSDIEASCGQLRRKSLANGFMGHN